MGNHAHGTQHAAAWSFARSRVNSDLGIRFVSFVVQVAYSCVGATPLGSMLNVMGPSHVGSLQLNLDQPQVRVPLCRITASAWIQYLRLAS